jgi:hypothetical protein
MKLGDDGLWWFRQSWLGDYMLCPERARLTAFHEEEQEFDGTDATALGTACHNAIELFLHGMPMDEAVERTATKLAEDWKAGTFKIVKIMKLSTMLRQHKNCCAAWLAGVYPSIGEPAPEIGIEGNFKHQVTETWGLKGTWDYLNSDGVLWDWKTAGGMWTQQYGPKGLEKKIQPTVYTAVVSQWTSAGSPNELDVDPSFRYGIMVKGAEPEAHIRTTTRHPGHWMWLEKQVEAIINMYNRIGPDDTWPLIDSDWLCSSEWCNHWDKCKGHYVQLKQGKY